MSGAELAVLVTRQLGQHLWQGLLLAGALAVALYLARRSASATRHALCSMALLALLVLPFAAWLPLPRWAPSLLGDATRQTVTELGAGQSRAAPADLAPLAGSIAKVAPGDRSRATLPSSFSATLKTLAPIGAWTVFAVWIIGAAWMLARLAIQLVRGERLRVNAAVWHANASSGPAGDDVEVRTSEDVGSPLVVGLVRPTIVLPTGFERRCSSADLGRVLAHERAHVQRRDGWWHLLQRMAEALFFFHPGVRWVARRMEFEREAACDDWAAARTGGLTAYSASLLTVCESVQRAPRPTLAVGVLSSKSQLARRVEKMLDNQRDHRPRRSAGWVAVFAASCAALVVALALTSPAPVLAGSDDHRDRAYDGERRGETPLIRAAQDRDASEVRRLLDAGADPNERARRGPRSPLYAGALAGDIDTLQVLLDRGAEVDRAVPGDATPLMAACRRGHLMAARLLVSRGADVNIELSGDGTPLIAAAAGGNAEIVELLLDQGADVNASVHGDGSPLIVAARHGHSDIVRQLIEAGAEPDDQVHGDGSPMINAAQSGDLLALEVLLAAGADPDLAVHGDGNPLIAASASGKTAMVERLLLAGADPDRAVNGDGSPLINAARSGRLDTVQVLVDAGADVDMAVSGDGSPLIAAAAGGHEEVARYLIDRGAVVDAIVPGDETALINAAGNGHVELAGLLLDAGADPNLAVKLDRWHSGRSGTTRVTRSPLSEARRSGSDAMVHLLIEHGATD